MKEPNEAGEPALVPLDRLPGRTRWTISHGGRSYAVFAAGGVLVVTDAAGPHNDGPLGARILSRGPGLGRREDPVAGRWTPRGTGLPFPYIRIGMEAPVTTGPGDRKAPAAGRLRASHAERELAVSALKTAYVQGRLDKDEFDVRVGRALGSRTHAELAAITADIPVDPAGVQQAPARARPALGVKSGVYLTAAASLLAAVLWAAAVAAGSAAALAAAVAVSGVVILTFFVTGDQLCQARQRKRSAGTLPPRPVPGSG